MFSENVVSVLTQFGELFVIGQLAYLPTCEIENISIYLELCFLIFQISVVSRLDTSPYVKPRSKIVDQVNKLYVFTRIIPYTVINLACKRV